MRKVLSLSLSLLLMVGVVGAYQETLRGDYSQLVTDVATDTTGAGITIAALNGLQADVDALEEGLFVVWPIASGSVDENIFIATGGWIITSIEEVHAVAGDDTSPVNFTVKRCNGTEAPGAGEAMHNTTIDLKGTADTVQAATLTKLTAYLTLADGDRIALDYAGTLASLAGGSVTIHMERA